MRIGVTEPAQVRELLAKIRQRLAIEPAFDGAWGRVQVARKGELPLPAPIERVDRLSQIGKAEWLFGHLRAPSELRQSWYMAVAISKRAELRRV
jgi:hypothetical protein